MSSEYAYMQVQISGVWQTFCSTLNDPQYILSEFRNAKNLYPSRLLERKVLRQQC